MSLNDFLLHSDLVSRVLALALLVLSVGSWVVMVWKWRLLSRVGLDMRRSIAAFWQATAFDDARQRVAQFDRDACITPLLEATLLPVGGTLATAGDRSPQLPFMACCGACSGARCGWRRQGRSRLLSDFWARFGASSMP
jgi:biopolymer transport protein ExbB